ncbi:DPY30 domain-containing protein 2 isoform X1 [Fukomys damarensis]|uniref:DPY30 domain-containing protein 2 isoform X1 n=1 Tax=Fukomys damarensis TaxID=885580 RepID=UPI00053F9B8B|nr:DPY30 domain-containing protein 2 isoform X1 [Fukomys damarensis]
MTRDLLSDLIYLESLEKSSFEYRHYWQVPKMETDYLKRCFGNSLPQALAEVAKVQPSDPIEYLAHWLYHYKKIATAKEKNRQEEIQLQEEYDCSLKEKEIMEMLKQEEYQIQQECEKCHKEQISTKKAIFMQEDTGTFEEVLKQESLPGTSDMTPAVPQQSPPSESADQTEQNFDTPQEINFEKMPPLQVAHEMLLSSKSPP